MLGELLLAGCEARLSMATAKLESIKTTRASTNPKTKSATPTDAVGRADPAPLSRSSGDARCRTREQLTA